MPGAASRSISAAWTSATGARRHAVRRRARSRPTRRARRGRRRARRRARACVTARACGFITARPSCSGAWRSRRHAGGRLADRRNRAGRSGLRRGFGSKRRLVLTRGDRFILRAYSPSVRSAAAWCSIRTRRASGIRNLGRASRDSGGSTRPGPPSRSGSALTAFVDERAAAGLVARPLWAAGRAVTAAACTRCRPAGWRRNASRSRPARGACGLRDSPSALLDGAAGAPRGAAAVGRPAARGSPRAIFGASARRRCSSTSCASWRDREQDRRARPARARRAPRLAVARGSARAGRDRAVFRDAAWRRPTRRAGRRPSASVPAAVADRVCGAAAACRRRS